MGISGGFRYVRVFVGTDYLYQYPAVSVPRAEPIPFLTGNRPELYHGDGAGNAQRYCRGLVGAKTGVDDFPGDDAGIVGLLCFWKCAGRVAGLCAQRSRNCIQLRTLDALYMERWMHERGENSLGKAQMWYSAIQYSSMGIGSLAGGILSGFSLWGIPYNGNLMTAFVLTATALIWIGFLIPQDTSRREESQNSASLTRQMLEQGKQALAAAGKSPVLMVCLVGAVMMGFATSGVELYWQPHLETLAENRDIGFLLGLLAFAGMAAVVLGSVVSGKLSLTVNTEQGRIRVYLAARLALAFIMITAALWLRLPVFCLLYTLYYLVMGCQDTMDAVLLQSNARDEMRGTLMSVQSFALRLGGLVSQLLSAAVLAFLGIPVLWLLLAAVFLLGSGFCGIYYQSQAGNAHKK